MSSLSQFIGKAITTTLPPQMGGTGAVTLPVGSVLIGAGLAAVSTAAPGATGNVLTSTGSTWVSAAAASGNTGRLAFAAF